MEKMGLNDIREAFLSFWESKKHHRLKSFSPNNSQDASLEGRKGRGAVAAGVGAPLF